MIPVLAAFTSMFFSCSRELDLDEATLLSIEKQAMIRQLDVLFDQAFTQPFEAEEDYNRFLKEKLLGDGKNFLTDNDVRMHCTLTDMAIRMNTEFERGKTLTPPATLFDMYRAKFADRLLNRTLLGDVPQQLRQGEQFARLLSKTEETTAFFEAMIAAFRAGHAPEGIVLNKRWRNLLRPGDLKNINYDFYFLDDGTLDIDKFYLFPFYTNKGNYKKVEYQISRGVDVPFLAQPVEYVFYDGKVMFVVHLNLDPLPGSYKLERWYCYEFDCETEPDHMTLSNPHIVLYMHPFLYVSGYGEPYYEVNYPEDTRKPQSLVAE